TGYVVLTATDAKIVHCGKDIADVSQSIVYRRSGSPIAIDSDQAAVVDQGNMAPLVQGRHEASEILDRPGIGRIGNCPPDRSIRIAGDLIFSFLVDDDATIRCVGAHA